MTLINGKKTTIISVASGKGGVGKSNFALNLALSLARLGKKTCLFDADLSLGNADILLGSKPTYTIEHLLSDDISINDVVCVNSKYPNFYLIPAGNGVARLATLEKSDRGKIFSKLSKFKENVEYLIIDCAAGASEDVLKFISISNVMLLIIIPEVTSIKDAYGLLKILKSKNIIRPVKVVVNKAQNKSQVENIFNKFKEAVNNFLQIDISLLGPVPDEIMITDAVNKQIPIIYYSPSSITAKIFDAYARDFIKRSSPDVSLEDFFATIFDYDPWEQYSADENSLFTSKISNQENIDRSREKIGDQNSYADNTYLISHIEKSMNHVFNEIAHLHKIVHLFTRKKYVNNDYDMYFTEFKVGNELIFLKSDNRFYTSKIIGWEVGKYLLVEATPPVIALLSHNNSCIVRYMCFDKLIEFETRKISEINELSDIAKIAYPKKYKEYNMRGSNRYKLNRECSIFICDKNEYVDGIILDVSLHGMLLCSNAPLEFGSGIKISFTLQNGKVIDDIVGVVRNARDNNEYGISLKEASGAALRYIGDFVDLFEKLLSEDRVIPKNEPISGKLENIFVPDLIHILSSSKKNYVLEISNMKGIAKLFFEDGSITHAEFNDLKGIDAFYEIIRIKEGEFSIFDNYEEVNRSFSKELSQSLLDGVLVKETSTRKFS